MGGVAGCFYNGRVHLEDTRFAAFGGVQYAAGDHELDEVGFGLGDVVNITDGILGAGGFCGKHACHVTAGHRNGGVCHEHAWADGPANLDSVAVTGVDVVESAYGADGGNAGCHGVARHAALNQINEQPGKRRAGDFFFEGLHIHRFGFGGWLGIFAWFGFFHGHRRHKMGVGVDEPGYYGAALEVYEGVVIEYAAIAGKGVLVDGSDDVVFYEHGGVFDEGHRTVRVQGTG